MGSKPYKPFQTPSGQVVNDWFSPAGFRVTEEFQKPKDKETKFRVFLKPNYIWLLTYDQLVDLADLLDDVLDQVEEEG